MSQSDLVWSTSPRYISEMERGLKIPSLTKIDELAESLSVHPLTLLSYAYMKRRDAKSLYTLQQLVEAELASLALVETPDQPAVRPKQLRRG